VLAFKTPFRDTNVLALVRRMREIAQHGLDARAAREGIQNEKSLLEPFDELATRGRTRADELLALYRGEWRGDLSRLFESYNFL
jgi:glutamate--cysteine ligase